MEFLQGAEIVGQAEPLLRIGVQIGQILADQLCAGFMAQHGDQGGIHIEQDAVGVAAADSVGRVGHQGTEVNLGAAQSSLRRAEGGVKETDQPGNKHEKSEMYDGLVVVGGGVRARHSEVGAYRQGERGSHQARLPAPVPGADHDGDGEDHQTAFHHIGEQQGWDEGENNAENGDAVSEDGSPSRGDVALAKKGELRSHKENLIPAMGWRELRESNWKLASRQLKKDYGIEAIL